MKTATFTMQGKAPYAQSRYLVVPKLEKETADAYERRVWKTRMHTSEDPIIDKETGQVQLPGTVHIPAMALKMALDAAAKYLSIPVPGKGKSTYTKHFTSGVLCTLDIDLGVPA